MGYRRSALTSFFVGLSIAMAAGSASAQLLTIDASKAKGVESFHILTSLVSADEEIINIPDDRDLVITDVVATCRTINPCAVRISGPFQNASYELVYVYVAPGSTASHAFNTGMRVAGGPVNQLFVQNLVNAGTPALVSVTITGYYVKK